jgi:2-polyprenyl-3-methyl-5-hydroxy-6-metoxy-1,4-benzoquinol methylase
LQWVDHSLIEAIKQQCGHTLLDLGCGVGGYSKVLQDAGYAVKAMDVNASYVETAVRLGVDAIQYDGASIPLADNAVDTVFMIEVLEHVPDPRALLAEVWRVTRRNVIVTVPNNTQRFNALLAWSHMLDVDHKNFFTVESLRSLLANSFHDVDVRQIVPVDEVIARDVLPRVVYRPYHWAMKLGVLKNRFFFRLLASASK